MPQICPPLHAGTPEAPVVERQLAGTQLDPMQRLSAYALLQTASAWSAVAPFASQVRQLHLAS
jgi:hypothetical protein